MKTSKIIGTGIVFLLLAALLLPALVQAYVDQGAAGSTRGYWRFNNGTGTTATNSSSQGLAGTLTNMEEGDWVPGKFGTALNFDVDGSNEYVTCGNSNAYAVSDMTIEAWVKTDSATTAQSVVAKWRNNGNKRHFKLGITAANKASFSVSTDGRDTGVVSVIGNTSIGTGWTHIAGTYDETTDVIRIFVNGLEDQAPVSVVMPASPTASALFIGADEDTTVSYFDGLIDEVRLLDFDRTATSGGVVINEVYIDAGAGDNWIELYNNSGSPVNIRGWDFYNEDGALFTLNSDTVINAGQWLVISEATPAYSNLGNLDLADYIRVYDLDTNNDGASENTANYQSMVEYAHWGNGVTVHADAIAAGLWTDATTVTVTGGDDTIRLTADGNNDEAVTDWESTSIETPGEPVPDVNSIIFFGSGLALLAISYLIFKKRRKHETRNTP